MYGLSKNAKFSTKMACISSVIPWAVVYGEIRFTASSPGKTRSTKSASTFWPPSRQVTVCLENVFGKETDLILILDNKNQ